MTDKKDMNNEEMLELNELSPDELFDVSGGLTEWARSFLTRTIRNYQINGRSKEYFMNLIEEQFFNRSSLKYFDTDRGELPDFVSQTWDEEMAKRNNK